MSTLAPAGPSSAEEPYPFKDQSEEDLFWRELARARELFRNADWSFAQQVLARMNEVWPYHPEVLGRLGVVHSYLHQWAESIDCLRTTTQLSPLSELASISLFLTLKNVANATQDDAYSQMAVDEASRFLLTTARPSVEYGYILREMKGELKDEAFEAHLKNIRLGTSHLEKPHVPLRSRSGSDADEIERD